MRGRNDNCLAFGERKHRCEPAGFEWIGKARCSICTKTADSEENVADRFPHVANDLSKALAAHRAEAARAFERFSDRPFTVGYADSTTLPARDGVAHGTIQRSARAPNNSFFKNWTRPSDTITWDIHVGDAGRYRATVFYTCAAENVGNRVRLTRGESKAETTVSEAFDPPLWDKSKERVAESHYFVKDFKPLVVGVIELSEGRAPLTLSCPSLVGGHGIDVYSVVLDRLEE